MPKRKAEREPEEPVEEKQGAEEEPSSSSTSGSDSGTSDDSEYPDVSDGVGGEGSESDSDDEREVVVDFEFYDPQESDYLGLKALLNAYLDGAQYNVSQLADTIIAQGAPGTVIKTGEDEDPVGLLTVLDAHGKRDLEVVKEIKQFIGSHVADSGSRRQLADALDKPGTGLLVSERLLNSPPVISGQLLRQLLDEMSAKAKKVRGKRRGRRRRRGEAGGACREGAACLRPGS